MEAFEDESGVADMDMDGGRRLTAGKGEVGSGL